MLRAIGYLPQFHPEIILRQRRAVVDWIQANARQGLYAGGQIFNPPKPILLRHQQMPANRAQRHARHRPGGKQFLGLLGRFQILLLRLSRNSQEPCQNNNENKRVHFVVRKIIPEHSARGKPPCLSPPARLGLTERCLDFFTFSA